MAKLLEGTKASTMETPRVLKWGSMLTGWGGSQLSDRPGLALSSLSSPLASLPSRSGFLRPSLQGLGRVSVGAREAGQISLGMTPKVAAGKAKVAKALQADEDAEAVKGGEEEEAALNGAGW